MSPVEIVHIAVPLALDHAVTLFVDHRVLRRFVRDVDHFVICCGLIDIHLAVLHHEALKSARHGDGVLPRLRSGGLSRQNGPVFKFAHADRAGVGSGHDEQRRAQKRLGLAVANGIDLQHRVRLVLRTMHKNHLPRRLIVQIVKHGFSVVFGVVTGVDRLFQYGHIRAQILRRGERRERQQTERNDQCQQQTQKAFFHRNPSQLFSRIQHTRFLICRQGGKTKKGVS